MSYLTEITADPRRAPASSGWLRRVGTVAFPILLILLWTAAVRLPFYQATDKDEFFFSVIASEWLRGNLPYVAYFDVKPPGIFFIFAAAQAVFGASQATIKGLEIAAIALGGWSLYAMLCTYATRRLAVWVAALFPVYTLAAGGLVAGVMLIQLPFLILAFWALFAASADNNAAGAKLRAAFFAGLAVGAAGMVKQTAIFEAFAIFVLLAVYSASSLRWRALALFVAGAAILPVAFGAYFAAVGAFSEMFNAVVVLALSRADATVAQSYGPEFAWYFTLPGATFNSALTTASLIFLWGAALFTLLRLPQIRKVIAGRVFIIALAWTAAAFAGVVAGKAICAYYILTMVPPMLILAGAVFAHGLHVQPQKQALAFALSIVAAVATLAYTDRLMILQPNAFLAGDFAATREVSAKVRELGLTPQDRLLVLNRGYAVYSETGALPPTPYFHALHLLGTFRTPSVDPLGEALAANARFVVVADPQGRHITEDPARIQRALDYLAAHYRVAAVVNGARDSFTLYELAR